MHLVIVDFSRIMTSRATFEGQRQLVRRLIIVLMTINQCIKIIEFYSRLLYLSHFNIRSH